MQEVPQTSDDSTCIPSSTTSQWIYILVNELYTLEQANAVDIRGARFIAVLGRHNSY